MIIALVIYTFVITAFFIVSVYANVAFIKKLFKVEDELERGLDVLDDVYVDIVAASKVQVFSDEPIVKKLVNDIQRARDAILAVANIISYHFTQRDQTTDE